MAGPDGASVSSVEINLGKAYRKIYESRKSLESGRRCSGVPSAFSENVKNILQMEPEPETICHKQGCFSGLN
jgi:hypothetical protein